MTQRLTNESRQILAAAAEVARLLQHEYVGTEHVLLALMENATDIIRDAITAVGVDAMKVRAQVAQLVRPGMEPVAARSLPLTPRINRAIEYAREESLNVCEYCVTPETLMLGLLREQEGVACQVLLNLGVHLEALRTKLVKVRLAQIKLVERVVRPLRASISRKREIREELLAHLSVIYQQEFARRAETDAAFRAASKRFGNPSEISCEIQNAIPFSERFNYLIERQLHYRAPESAAHFAYRIACLTLIVLVPILGFTTLGVTLRYGWTDDVRTLARIMLAIAIFTPVAQFACWLTYIELRDALWGAFGSLRSKFRALLLTLCVGCAALLYVEAIDVIANMRLDIASIFDLNRVCIAILHGRYCRKLCS